MPAKTTMPIIAAIAFVLVCLISILLLDFMGVPVTHIPWIVLAKLKGEPVADVPIVLAERKVERARVRLLCETDHQALLDACRELSRQAMSGKIEEGIYEGWAVSRLPRPIPSLRPYHVSVGRDGLVGIEMFTGWHSLGVYAFPDGYQRPSKGYGDRKLVEGLWYYEVTYLHDPNYDKTIDALLVKCGKVDEDRD